MHPEKQCKKGVGDVWIPDVTVKMLEIPFGIAAKKKQQTQENDTYVIQFSHKNKHLNSEVRCSRNEKVAPGKGILGNKKVNGMSNSISQRQLFCFSTWRAQAIIIKRSGAVFIS